MPPPVYVPGQVLLDTDVNNWFLPSVIVKPASTSRASNTTVTADPDLSLPVTANWSYWVNACLLWNGATGADLNWAWNGPGTAQFLGHAFSNQLTGQTSPSGPFKDIVWDGGSTFNAQHTAGAYGAGVPAVITAEGILNVGGTGGTFGVSWAQNTSGATATIMAFGSFIILRRVA